MVVVGWGNVAKLSFQGTPSWSPLVTSEAPLTVWYGDQGILYDASRHRLALAGAYIDLVRRDHGSWSLDLEALAWEPLGPRVPERRLYHTMIRDAGQARMILYGGIFDWDPVGGLWSLPLDGTGTWTPLAATGAPEIHRDHSAIEAPTRGSMIVFGGFGSSFRNDVWEFDLDAGAWSQIVPSGTPPEGRMRHTAVYDATRDRMVVFGGSATSGVRNDVWVLSLGGSPSWSLVTPSGTAPTPRNGHSAIYDPVRDRMIVFGGIIGGSPPVTNEVWQLTFSPSPAWSQITPTGTPPIASGSSWAVYDPVRDRMLVSGGQHNSSSVWALALAGPAAWTTLAPVGPGPVGRGEAAAAYDPGLDQLIQFGGFRENSLGEPYVLGDTWALRFSTPLDVADTRLPGATLAAAVPNPARRTSRVSFSLPAEAHARLAVFDLAGRRVSTLREGLLPAGSHAASWNLAGDDGARVAPGLYLVELRIGRDRLAEKLIVLD
jgi:hypothetical protein